MIVVLSLTLASIILIMVILLLLLHAIHFSSICIRHQLLLLLEVVLVLLELSCLLIIVMLLVVLGGSIHSVICSIILHLLVHHLLLHLSFGHFSCRQIIVDLLLSLVVLSCLSLLECLNSHPLLVGVSVVFLSKLLLDFLTTVQLSQMGALLSLLKFLLKKPIVHGLHPGRILVSLLLRYVQKFFLYVVLGLTSQFLLQSLLTVLEFEPFSI